MTDIMTRRLAGVNNTWLFYREVEEQILQTIPNPDYDPAAELEDGEAPQPATIEVQTTVMVEEEVDRITFSPTVSTSSKALAARTDLGEEIEPGYVPPPFLQATYSAAIQQHLDATARERGYDNIQTGVSYRDDPNPQFAAEGQALFEWRSAVWTAATAMLADVDPKSPPAVTDVIGDLPAFGWPS